MNGAAPKGRAREKRGRRKGGQKQGVASPLVVGRKRPQPGNDNGKQVMKSIAGNKTWSKVGELEKKGRVRKGKQGGHKAKGKKKKEKRMSRRKCRKRGANAHLRKKVKANFCRE